MHRIVTRVRRQATASVASSSRPRTTTTTTDSWSKRNTLMSMNNSSSSSVAAVMELSRHFPTISSRSFRSTGRLMMSGDAVQYEQHQPLTVSTSSVSSSHDFLPGGTEKRLAIQLFLELLRLAADLGVPQHREVTQQLPQQPIRPNHRILLQVWKRQQQVLQERQQQQQQSDMADTDTLSIKKRDVDIILRDDLPTPANCPHEALVSKLNRAIRRKDATKCLQLFEQAQELEQQSEDYFVLSKKMTSNLFFLLTQSHHIVEAYKVLNYFNRHFVKTSHGETKWLLMYKRIINNIGDMKLGSIPRKKVYKFVTNLLDEIEEMDRDAKQLLYPNLVVALANQRSVLLGRFAHRVYDAMIELELEMKEGWLTKLLSFSKYNRQDDLPYHDILARIVEMGGIPHWGLVLPVIHNMFPYSDTASMCITLQALVDLETIKQNSTQPKNWFKDLNRMDMSTLEMISTSAARVGDTTLILLVWDVLKVSGYQPTETIFENTILTFASHRKHHDVTSLDQAFVTMSTMTDFGFVPTRSLVRGFSYLLRNDLSDVDRALEVLLQSRDPNNHNHSSDNHEKNANYPSLLSLYSANVVMSAYAERGETDQTFHMLRIMEDNNIIPNADSYSFAMEVLGKDIHRRELEDDQSHVHRNLELADVVLTSMEEKGIEPSSFVVRHYVELLCQVGEVDTATSVVEQCLVSSNATELVCNKSLYRVAISNANMNNYPKAKELASQMSEVIPGLYRKIGSKEQRYKHLEKARQFKARQGQAASLLSDDGNDWVETD